MYINNCLREFGQKKILFRGNMWIDNRVYVVSAVTYKTRSLGTKAPQ